MSSAQWKQVFFAVIDEYEQDAEGGIRLRRPIFRERVFARQDRAWTDPASGAFYPEHTVVATPDTYSGLYGPYSTDPKNKDDAAKIQALTRRAEMPNSFKPIIGPFATRMEAQVAQQKMRAKLPVEEVKQLKTENEAKSQQIAELKAKLAEAQKKPKQP